jgi:hypothetical protein
MERSNMRISSRMDNATAHTTEHSVEVLHGISGIRVNDRHYGCLVC